MKKKVKNIYIGFVFFLALLFLLPTIVQSIHALDGHHHVDTCKEITAHLHEKQVDCSVCNFHLSNFTYSESKYTQISITTYKTSVIDFYISLYYSHSVSDNPLRGPPVLLS